LARAGNRNKGTLQAIATGIPNQRTAGVQEVTVFSSR
jgi:hypothetical protein